MMVHFFYRTFFSSLVTALSLLMFAGCQTTKTPHQELVQKRLHSHHDIIKANTKSKKVYNGLQQAFEFSSTLMTSKLSESEWKVKQTIYQWSDEELKSQQEKFKKKYGSDLQVFLSFFTPARKQNNLDKKTSKWKVLLMVEGKKYEGKVKKRKDLLDDIRAFYPQHTRWSKPYFVSFPITMKDIDGKPTSLIVTGPVGTTEVSF